MEKKVVFAFLILCGIVSQGICTSTEENEKSSDLHIRNKRLVGRAGHISEASFLVSLVANGINHCPATLLTINVAITSMKCFKRPNTQRWSIQTDLTEHEVVRTIQYGYYDSKQPALSNLALAFFQPRIDYYTSYNRPIKIFNGTLAAQHAILSVYNWAHQVIGRKRRLSASDLQAVNVKLEEFHYCEIHYPGRVGPDNLCAKSLIRGEHCETFDYGAPLVINRQLVGIFASRGGQCADPEVFMSVLSRRVKAWIHNYVPGLRFL